ncbi:lipase family protein [Nocardia pseudovaccinii]|uniref:lipase family protein n=1 Tax=Nocardia pseudovaccinii TaxID=189540 RepID=UPI0007A54A5B|nr:lipase family protein [Nocardia pseudovaccinii]
MSEPLTDDEFYAATSIEVGSKRGEVLRLREVAVPQLHSVAHAWQIIYVSSDSYGELIPASGIVIVPDTVTDAGAGPILGYCPVFRGLGGRCAPSQLLADGAEPEADYLAIALDRGWTVAVADGRGLGITGLGPHTFLAGRCAGQTILDLTHTTRGLPDLNRSAPIALWGYADGGRNALWAAEIQHEYAPELELRGVAAGAVVADPGELVAEIDDGPCAGLGLAGLVGLARAYAHLPMLHILTTEGHLAAANIENLDAARILARYRQPLGRWCERTDPWMDPMWRYVLARERCAQQPLHVPVHLYHGTQDTLIPVESARRLISDYRGFGVDLNWREYPVDHLQAAIDGAGEAIARLASNLQHTPSRPTRSTPPTTTPPDS